MTRTRLLAEAVAGLEPVLLTSPPCVLPCIMVIGGHVLHPPSLYYGVVDAYSVCKPGIETRSVPPKQ